MRQNVADKVFDVFIGAPLGVIATIVATKLWDSGTWEPFVIGVLFFVSAVAVIEAIRWERRERPFYGPGVRQIFRSHAKTIRAAKGDAGLRVRHAAGAIRASLGEYQEKEFWKHVTQFPRDEQAEPAACFLEALAAKPDLREQEELLATL